MIPTRALPSCSVSEGRRDLVVLMLAVAGVLGAISLAGIFVVYLVNTIGDNNNNGQTTAAVATPGATGASGATGAASANGAAGSSPPAAATPPAAAGKTG